LVTNVPQQSIIRHHPPNVRSDARPAQRRCQTAPVTRRQPLERSSSPPRHAPDADGASRLSRSSVRVTTAEGRPLVALCPWPWSSTASQKLASRRNQAPHAGRGCSTGEAVRVPGFQSACMRRTLGAKILQTTTSSRPANIYLVSGNRLTLCRPCRCARMMSRDRGAARDRGIGERSPQFAT